MTIFIQRLTTCFMFLGTGWTEGKSSAVVTHKVDMHAMHQFFRF